MVDCAHCVIFLQVVLYTLSSMSREQRANLKFLAKFGKTPSESFALLQQVYGEETLSCTRAFEWHKRFKEGREEVGHRPLRLSSTGSNSESIRVQGDPPAPNEITPGQEEGSVGEQRLGAPP